MTFLAKTAEKIVVVILCDICVEYWSMVRSIGLYKIIQKYMPGFSIEPCIPEVQFPSTTLDVTLSFLEISIFWFWKRKLRFPRNKNVTNI